MKERNNIMFTNNIKQIVEEKNIGIYKLAKDVGISPQAMYLLLDREDLGGTPIRTIIRLAEVLGVEPCDLYTQES